MQKEQYCKTYPIAQRVYTDKKCTVKEAWRTTISKIHNRKSMAGSDSELIKPLIRHATYGASSSGVEQTFAKFKGLFGEHRLGGHEEMERDIMKLVFDKDGVCQDDVIKLAREHWVQSYGMKRESPKEERIDTGSKRKHKLGTKMSEAQLIKRRRRDVKKLVGCHDSDDVEKEDVGELQGWTAKHEKEVNFQKDQLQKRKVEAFERGVLIGDELDDGIEEAAARQRVRNESNRKKRVAFVRRGDRRMTEQKLDKVSLRGMSVYFEKSCRTDKLRELAEVLLLRSVHDRMEAVVRALCLTVVPLRSPALSEPNRCGPPKQTDGKFQIRSPGKLKFEKTGPGSSQTRSARPGPGGPEPGPGAPGPGPGPYIVTSEAHTYWIPCAKLPPWVRQKFQGDFRNRFGTLVFGTIKFGTSRTKPQSQTLR